jgi:hypothetical protein
VRESVEEKTEDDGSSGSEKASCYPHKQRRLVILMCRVWVHDIGERGKMGQMKAKALRGDLVCDVCVWKQGQCTRQTASKEKKP